MISALFCIYVELDEKIKNYIRMELLGQRYKYLYDLNLENNAFLLFISVDLVKRKIRFWVFFFSRIFKALQLHSNVAKTDNNIEGTNHRPFHTFLYAFIVQYYSACNL